MKPFSTKTLFVLVVPVIVSLPAQAFMPSWYPASGEYHKNITLNALDEIYAAYGYGPYLKPYTNNIQNARDKISQGSADTDKLVGIKDNPDWHCDDERLNECSNNIKSQTDVGIDDIKKSLNDYSRPTIGHVVHTLQDFYAHSNWVEMNGAVVDPEMGYGNLSNLAAPNEDTCIPNNLPGLQDVCAISNNNIITHHLTSGYYYPYPVPAGVNKCFHGGSFDGYGWYGINKDAAVCDYLGIMVIAPHASLHKDAADAARKATVEYFNKIKARVSDEDFKQFLGFGAPSLGFSIDTTTSMSATLDSVKNSVTSIVNSRLGTDKEPSNYVLSIIDDPVVPPAMQTTDASVFIDRLNGTEINSSSSNTTCPELYGQGIYNAVALLDDNSTLFVYTDDTARDPEIARQALMLASSKGIGVITSLSPSNCNDNGASASSRLTNDNLYSTISEVTGGQVFNITSSEAGTVAQLSDVIVSNYYTRLFAVDDALNSGTPLSYEFIADSTLDTLLVSASLQQSGQVTVFRPDGSVVNSGDADVTALGLSKGASYIINHPAVGVWKVVVEGSGRFSVNVGGSSPLSFSKLDFVALEEGQDPGYFPVQGYPVAGVPQTVEATISSDVSDVHFEFRAPDGTLLGSVTLNPVTVYPGVQTLFASENVSLPTQPFRVYAVGKDANGQPFERVLSKLIVPQTVAVVGPGDQELPPDEETSYVFKVTNYGADGSFTVAAVDDRGFVVGLSATSVTIGSGETQEVSVKLNPGAASDGTVSTVTFMAIAASDPNALGNYAVVAGTVRSKTQPPPPPVVVSYPVPTAGAIGLLALMGVLAGLAFWRMWRRQQHKG